MPGLSRLEETPPALPTPSARGEAGPSTLDAPAIGPRGGVIPGTSLETLPCLDALRGIAVLLVILYHLGSASPTVFHPAAEAALRHMRLGYTGVHLFLVLSGFCLTHSMIRRSRLGRAPSYRSYLTARWRRIAPPYYVAMAIYLAIPLAAWGLGQKISATFLTWRQVGVHVLFLHGLWSDTIAAISTPFWSLSLEFQFYVMLPLLLAIAGRAGPVAMVLGVAAATVAFRAVLARFFPDRGHLINGFFLSRLTEFALGMGIAWWYNHRPPGRSPGAAPGLLAGAAACFVVGAWAEGGRGAPEADYAFGLGYSLLLASVLVGVERSPRFRRVFESPALIWVGGISYSLYLCHSLVLVRAMQVYRVVAHGPGLVTSLAVMAIILAAVILSGWAFHVVVERRFLPRRAARIDP